ncbi:MAG TPA: methyltransferase [Verrucomicrobiae bacterium]|jgi:SAM-dependent methyltransferase|nr:methyltransferase [Verrucomicrobiae bacterium]
MTFDLQKSPVTDPTPVYRYRDGLYAADLLACALVFLDFFTWLEKGPATTEQICRHFEIAPRPTDVMLTLFVAMGLLKRQGDSVHVTESGHEHLVSSSPWFLGPYYASLKDRPVCKDFLQVLKTDKPANWGSFKNEKDWARAMEEPAFAESFTAAMDCRGVFLGQALAKKLDGAKRKSLLDIAGGSGIYACSIVAHHSHLSAAVFEKAPVNKVAANAISKRGFSDKVRVIEGDMFGRDFPNGFDLHLISNVLHDWNESTVMGLLRKSFTALEPGGMLVIHDVHINADKSGPLPAASYSALLMHATEGKCYSLSELYPWLQNIGFRNLKFTPTGADRSIVTAEKPA